jgi:pyruvate dehydrogenase E1 component alpha subunit
MGDPERYRKAEEVHQWQENDPIGIYRKELIDQGIASEAELDGLDGKAQADTAAAVQFAENSPEPEPEALFEHIYVEG